MAQIVEEQITITVSRLVKNGEKDSSIQIGGETIESLQAVAEELIGGDAVIEVTYDGSTR